MSENIEIWLGNSIDWTKVDEEGTDSDIYLAFLSQQWNFFLRNSEVYDTTSADIATGDE
jgi:hypothetical protein